MIFYFSGTGNSKYVATRLAERTGEQMVSMSESLANRTLTFVAKEGERVGFVTPVYFWGLPTVVIEFVSRMQLQAEGHHFIYHVLTFGTTTGQAHYMMKRLLEQKGMSLQGRYCVKMVDTWTPIFNLTNKAKLERVMLRAEKGIDFVCNKINDRQQGDFDRYKFPHVLASLYYITYRYQRKTSHLHVKSDRCISCGLCARKCPVDAIAMENGLPVWTKPRCTMCLGCLHRCPVFAIQYGKSTLRHGQFVNPNVQL